MNSFPAHVLANLVLDAREAHQASWNYALHLQHLEQTLKDKRKARLAGEQDFYINSTQDNYYSLDHYRAAQKVCTGANADLASPVASLLAGAWNESGDWALTLTGRKEEKSQAFVEWEAAMEALYVKYDKSKDHEGVQA